MKIVKWWHSYKKHGWSQKEKFRERVLWIILWIRVNLLTINKEKKEMKHNLSLGNISYKMMKKYLNDNE